MKQVALNAKTRSAVGTSAVNRLRAEGAIPAVLYGESGTQHLQIDARDFSQAWRSIGGRAALLEVHTDGAEESTFAIIREAQRDSMTDRFLHIDLFEIVRGKDMTAEIPVHPIGTAFGVKNQQGVLEVNTHEVEVRCRPRDLPEYITIDVSALKVGDSIKIGELTAIEGVTVLGDVDQVVVSCVGASGGKSGDEETAEAEAEAEETVAETTKA